MSAQVLKAKKERLDETTGSVHTGRQTMAELHATEKTRKLRLLLTTTCILNEINEADLQQRYSCLLY